MKRSALVVALSLLIFAIAGCGTITGGFQPPQSQAQLAFLQRPVPTPSAPHPNAPAPQVNPMVMNTDGSGQKQVGPTGNYVAVDISHDGTMIALTEPDPELGPQLYVVTVATGNSVNITPQYKWAEMPEFPPDGSKIYFVNTAASCWEIWSINTNGSDPTNLGDQCTTAMYEVTVAPDGRLYFRGNSELGYGIYRMDANGDNKELLIEDYANHPSVTPDGTKLVFELEAEGMYIATANIDGSDVQTLTTGGTEEDPIVIGDKIFYISNANSNPEVYSMDLNGGNQTRLTNNTALDWFGGFWAD